MSIFDYLRDPDFASFIIGKYPRVQPPIMSYVMSPSCQICRSNVEKACDFLTNEFSTLLSEFRTLYKREPKIPLNNGGRTPYVGVKFVDDTAQMKALIRDMASQHTWVSMRTEKIGEQWRLTFS